MKEPPTVYVDPDAEDGGAAYVRVPLPPEVLAAAREHVDNGARLYAMLTGGVAVAPADLLALVQKTGAALVRDVARLRKPNRR